MTLFLTRNAINRMHATLGGLIQGLVNDQCIVRLLAKPSTVLLGDTASFWPMKLVLVWESSKKPD